MDRKECLLRARHEAARKKKEIEKEARFIKREAERNKYIKARKHVDLRLKEIYEGLSDD